MEIEDLFRPLKEHKSSVLGDKLAAAWEKELENYNTDEESVRLDSDCEVKHKEMKTPSLQKALIKVFGARIALYGVALAIMELVLR